MLEETRQQPEALSNTLEDGAIRLRELRRHLESQTAAAGDSGGTRHLGQRGTVRPVSDRDHHPHPRLAGSTVGTYPVCQSAGFARRADGGDLAIGRIDRHERGAGGRAQPGSDYPGITNEPNSTMAEISEYTLLARAGTEESVAATKTYTCQLLALYLVAYALGGEVSFDALRQLPQCVEDVLEIEDRVGEIAERYMYMTRAVTVGRGLNYANALEFGLKLMETCYVVTERLSSAD